MVAVVSTSNNSFFLCTLSALVIIFFWFVMVGSHLYACFVCIQIKSYVILLFKWHFSFCEWVNNSYFYILAMLYFWVVLLQVCHCTSMHVVFIAVIWNNKQIKEIWALPTWVSSLRNVIFKTCVALVRIVFL